MPYDIADLQLNPESVIKALRQMSEAFVKESGLQGAALDKFRSKFETLADKIIVLSDRNTKAFEKQAQAAEKLDSTFGLKQSQKFLYEQDRIISKMRELGASAQHIDRVKNSYDSLINKAKQAEQEAAGSGAAIQKAFLGVKDLFEGRANYAAIEFGKSIARLGPIALAAGVSFGVLAATIIGIKEAANSLGELGLRVHEAAVQTGLSAEEVQRFDYAAKAVGKDITVVERMMRGLTSALEDQTEKGAQARAVIQSFGIDAKAAAAGLVPTSDVLIKISQGLHDQPNMWQRNRDALDLFRRVGIDTLPVLEGLAERAKKASDLHIGFSDTEIEHLRRLSENMREVNAAFDDFINKKVKFPLEFTALFALGQDPGKIFREPPPQHQIFVSNAQQDAEAKGRLEKSLNSDSTYNAEKRLSELKQAADEARSNAERILKDLGAGRGLPAPGADVKAQQELDKTTAAYQKQVEYVKQLKQNESDVRTLVEARRKLTENIAQKEAELRHGNLGRPFEAQRLYDEFIKERAASASDKQRVAEQLQPLFALEGRQRLEKAGFITPAIHGAGFIGPSETLQRIPESDIDKLKTEEKARGDFSAHLNKNGEEFLATLQRQTKELEEQQRPLKQLLEYDLKRRENEEQAGLRVKESLTLDQSARTQQKFAEQSFGLKVKYLDEEYQHEQGLIDAQRKYIDDYDAKSTDLRLKHEEEIGQARNQYIEQAAALERHQLEQTKSTLESLYQTLFTRPQDFGKKLRETLISHSVNAAAGTLANATAPFVQPLLGGFSGGGFGQHIPITSVGGSPAVPVTIVGTGGAGGTVAHAVGSIASGSSSTYSLPQNVLSLPGGFSFPNFSSGGSTGSPSASVGSVPAPWLLGAPSPFGFGLGGPFGGGNPAEAIGPGGTSGFTGRVGSLGGGSTGGGGFGGLIGGFGNLKQALGIGTQPHGLGQIDRIPAGIDPGLDSGDYGTTTAGSVAGSPLATSLAISTGSTLALAGLTGNRRGTWAGIGESTAGGALTGFGIGMMVGGPLGGAIGAGVGAAAGFVAGGIEKLAGVESPQNEAKRLVKQLYKINISDQMAAQIVSLAQQKYGNTVSIAVRSPEVRQMLNLYAAGTGQNSLISASTPHAGSLTEQGGQLYQDPSYQYGRSFAFSSNLPTYGGQPTGGTLPSPGSSSPTYVAVNVSGAGLAPFMTGQYVTSDYVQNQFSTAQSYSNGRLGNSAVLNDPGFSVLGAG